MPYPDLVTPAEVLADLPGLSGRPNLGDLIARASARVQGYCGRTFGPQALTAEVYDGNSSPRIWLRQVPVVEVIAITISGYALDNTNGDAWTFDPRTGELVRGLGQAPTRFQAWFPEGVQNVLVTYTAGEAVPDDVKEATILTVAYYAAAPKLIGLVKREKLGDYEVELSDQPRHGLPDIARSILSQYVLDWFA